MTDYYVRGQSQTWRPSLGGGSGEGAWYADGGCSEVILPGDNGTEWIVWASTEPTVTGNGDLSGELFSGGMWILTFNGAGPVTLSGASILAHRVLDGLVYSDCG